MKIGAAMREDNQRLVYLDFLRIVAVILVIFNHTDGCFLYYANTGNPITFLYSMLGSIVCMTDVPLFFMITGALLLGREETYGQLLRRRVLRIGIVLVLFSGIHYLVDAARGAVETLSLAYFIQGLFCGTLVEQYWYLYAYLGILFLMPLLRAWVRGLRPQDYGWLLLLECALGVLLPALYNLAGSTMPSYLYILSTYIFYLLMGYGLANEMVALPEIRGNRREAERNDRGGRLRGILIAIAICILLSMVYIMLMRKLRGDYDRSDMDVAAPILTILIFEAARRLCAQPNVSDRAARTIRRLGSCSFGVYLLEHMVRILLLPIYLYLTEHSVGVIACTVYVIGTYVIGVMATMILKKIPLLRELL